MKALTICQPYASLIVRGQKRIENRTWPTMYRGLLYIHAGKSRQWLSDPSGRDPHPADNYGIPLAQMPFGAVVAIANLVNCVTIESILAGRYDDIYPWAKDHEHAEGPWCWILDAVSPIGPWPWRGAQGLFDIDTEELDRVANQTLGIAQPLSPGGQHGK